MWLIIGFDLQSATWAHGCHRATIALYVAPILEYVLSIQQNKVGLPLIAIGLMEAAMRLNLSRLDNFFISGEVDWL